LERPGRAWRKGRQFAFAAPQMGAFVTAIAAGATMEEAARAAGVAVSTLYYRRRTCPGFAAAWAAAAAASAGPLLLVNRSGPTWQLQRARRKRPFCRARKQAFLDHFAATCNVEAACAAAGVGMTSVYRHLKSDPAFARGFAEALAIGHPQLEAEAARMQLAEQRAYRIAPDPAAEAQSFERTLQLLREYHRGGGRIGQRSTAGRLQKWSFGAAMTALEKRLKLFGIDIEDDAGDEEEDKRAASG
jgi:hypothetical protein